MNSQGHSSDITLLDAAEAARFLGLSRGALYQAVRRHQLPARRLGRRLRFVKEELVDALGGEVGRTGASGELKP